ncbi:hypothetical protein DFJ73DRAFT_759838 [Zopfochytrium polystomum]|nr:hypothetical protein DFJ73DRAFT_759838 [Zopfochytrium polystomum]
MATKASVLASKSVNILQPLTEHKLGTKAPKRLAEDLNGKDIRKKVKPPLRNYSESKNAASDEALPGLVTLPKANTEETERVDASADLATALSALQERKSDTALCDGRQPLCDEVELLRDKLQIESQHVDAMRRMLADEATLRSDLEKRLADTISKAESWRMQWEGVRQDLIAKERELESMRASNCNPVSRPPRSTEVPDFPVTNSPRYCSAENLVNQALGDGNHGRAAIGEVALASLLARLQGPNKNELRDVSRWISDLRGEIKDCYKVITELESLPTTVEGLRNEVRDCYAVIEALEGQMADLTAERKGKPAEKSFTWVNIQTQTPMTDCTVGNTEGAVAKFHLLRVASSIREQEHEEEQLRNLKEISDLSLSLLNAEE